MCETATLTYACRMQGPAAVAVYNVVSEVQFAALPATRTGELRGRVAEIFPAIVGAESIFETGMRNLNAVEHPAQALLNAGRVEHTRGDFRFYLDGTTPSVARVIEHVDAERLKLAGGDRRQGAIFRGSLPLSGVYDRGRGQQAAVSSTR